MTCEIFWIRDWIHVSCTGRQILYYWATREAPVSLLNGFLLQGSPRSEVERPGSSWFCRLNCPSLGRPTRPSILNQQLWGFTGLLHVCYCTSQHPSVVGTIFILITWIRKLRNREMKEFIFSTIYSVHDDFQPSFYWYLTTCRVYHWSFPPSWTTVSLCFPDSILFRFSFCLIICSSKYLLQVSSYLS